MRITINPTFDIETWELVSHDGQFEYDGPVLEFKTGKTSEQKQADTAATTDLSQQSNLTGAAQGTLGQFEGPVQQSPFYKALLTQGTEATSNAYDNAASNVRARANQAGFGYNQPVEQDAEAGVRTAEAADLARVPDRAMLEATGPALQAAGQTGSMGMGYGNQALGFNKSAADQEQQRGNLWKTLLQTGGQVAGGMAAGGMFGA